MNDETLFHRALELPVGERAGFLAAACAGNAELRQRVEQLLQAHDEPGSFMAVAPAGLTGAYTPQSNGTGAPEVEAIGTRIGPYKLLQQIGEGGMGVVYMAEQEQPVRRRVALKIIKPGMDTVQVVARFEAERQALALMDHQNIAKVLDVGATESGRPYFVMELVNGIPITNYCDQEHLTPRERLELFVPICQAVQHAHQKGIIHRDLKPSNVLVALYDGKPVPKVIDFGVAKATSQRLTERTMFTEFGQVIGTLEYMAPEQAERNALDVDTRCDIYSLGVMLYELLTGSTPLDKKKLHSAVYTEMMRMIREDEPAKPSTRLSESGDALPSISAQRKTEPAKLSKLMRGELDWIVMKALEKDRGRRYETANGFARDIQRYLSDDPVEACPPSASYRLRKFARKNRRLLATSGAFVVVLLLGVVGLVAGLISVNAERKRTADALAQVTEEQTRTTSALAAETKARAQTRNAINAMTDVVMEKVLAQQQSLGKMEREFLGSIVGFYEQFAAGNADTEQARAAVADGQFRVAKLRALLGDLPQAIAGYREALNLWEQLSQDHPTVRNYRQNVATCYHNLGILLFQVGNRSDAESVCHKAVAMREKLVADYPDIAHLRGQLGDSHGQLGILFQAVGKLPESEASYEQAIAISQKLVSEFSNVPQHRRALSQGFMNRGSLYLSWRRWSEAELATRQAIELLEQLPLQIREMPDVRGSLASAYNNLGTSLGEQGKRLEAVKGFEQMIAIQQKLVQEFPGIPDHRHLLAGGHSNLANQYSQMWKLPDAESTLRQAIEIGEGLVQVSPNVVDYRLDLGASHVNYGICLRLLGKNTEALDWYAKAISSFEALLGPDPSLTKPRLFLGNALGQRAFALGKLNRHADALLDWDRALTIPDHPERDDWRINRAVTLAHLGKVNEPIATAIEMTRGDKVPGGNFANAASVYAIAAANEKVEAKLREQYALETIALLRRAMATDFFDSGTEIIELKKDPDYDALRDRAEFKMLMAELEARLEKKEEKK